MFVCARMRQCAFVCVYALASGVSSIFARVCTFVHVYAVLCIYNASDILYNHTNIQILPVNQDIFYKYVAWRRHLSWTAQRSKQQVEKTLTNITRKLFCLETFSTNIGIKSDHWVLSFEMWWDDSMPWWHFQGHDDWWVAARGGRVAVICQQGRAQQRGHYFASEYGPFRLKDIQKLIVFDTSTSSLYIHSRILFILSFFLLIFFSLRASLEEICLLSSN